MLLAAALLASQAVGGNLAAFDSYCAKLDGIDLMAGRLKDAGLTSFAPERETELSRLVTAVVGPDPKFNVDVRTFRGEAAPDTVVLIAQMKAPDGTGSIECKVLDEKAPQPSLDELVAWASRSPAKKFVQKDGVMLWAFQPGQSADQRFVAITYTPVTSRPQFPGVGLSIRTVKFLP